VKDCVWCAASARRIVGPVFFNETIKCGRYVQVFLGQLFPDLQEERLYAWFQQDSATAHSALNSLQALSYIFVDTIISSGIWPARSPDLNLCLCNFFFWGNLKDKVYNCNPERKN
jgi:hypothetical protein